MKTEQQTIDFSNKVFHLEAPFPNETKLPVNQHEVEKQPEFTIEISNVKHILWVKEICDVTLTSALTRGTGISGRPPELLEEKIKKGEAVMAFALDGSWAGFSFISSWDNDRYVSNSGLIVAPQFRNTGLAKKIKRKIFELSRQKYPNAIIFSLTTGLAVMKMNHELGFVPVTYSEITNDEDFWEGCKSCVNCPVLMSKERKNCLCTAMRYDPKDKISNI
ncbi:GNAT family N-acetyltransferase [Flavobacterium pectinovorum]|uniref:GNAT family N-acetyltransferase n=1 Tax=Flavobacterium pectinovorum TaxID=29533 RepID=UPI00265E22A2|nr:GNAT family N-acetyltransferase [Flavobacterium pectinovorum]WKL48838.1 GNAT family N-acetyltransferase [Flavobacterium pectinovorum]